MGIFIVGFIFVICAVLLLIRSYCCGFNNEAQEYERDLKNFLQQQNFILSKRLVIKNAELEFFVDDENKKFSIMTHVNPIYKKENEPEYQLKMFNYSDLLDFELNEDYDIAMQGRGIMSAAGGLLFGFGGAVVGSVAGDRRIKKTNRTVVVNLKVNNLKTPNIVVNCDTGFSYESSKQIAQELCGILTIIKEQKQKTTNQPQEKNQIQRLEQLEELRTKNLISEEEYHLKRNSILEEL